MAKTPDFGEVRPSTLRVKDACYRAVVKNSRDVIIFESIETFINRDNSSSVNMSARDMAKRFISNELRAEGHTRYNSGDYSYSYTGHAPFFDRLTALYRCINGYWHIVLDGRAIPTDRVPNQVLNTARIG